MPRTPTPEKPATNRLTIAYIAIASIVIISMLAAAIASMDLGSLLRDDVQPTIAADADVVAAQQTVVALNPDDVGQQQLLANLLVNSGRVPEAVQVYEQLIESDPNTADIRLEFARVLQDNGMPEDAEAQFLRVLELQPENHTAHYYLARLYMDWHPRRQNEAVQHFQRVIEIAPNSFLAEQSRNVLNSLGQTTPVASPVSSGRTDVRTTGILEA